jgi:membrane protein
MSTTDAQEQTKARRNVDPDSAAKPESPAQLEGRSWKYVFVKTMHEFSEDQCTDIAAGLTYYAVLSLFPGLVAVFSILGVLGQSTAAVRLITDILRQVAPSMAKALEGPLSDVAHSPAAGFALITGAVLAVWAASGYVGAFSRAMNRIYEIEEGRPLWKLKPAQLLVTIIAIALVAIATILLVVSGPVTDTLGSALGLGTVPRILWSVLKWPVLAFIVVLIIAILYYATPNVKQPKFRWVSIGSLLAILTLAVATALFAIYVANFSHYERTYGSLAGIIVFLLWLWIANVALLFGAEFDSELERGRELQGGLPAEEVLQLPPRDTRNVDKADKRKEKDLEQGRDIQEQHADTRPGAPYDRRDDGDGSTS